MKEVSDSELVSFLQDGSFSAFDELYKRNWERLYKVAYRAVGSEQTSMDLVQDVFLSLWKNRLRLDSTKCLQAFLFTILKNNTINWYKKEMIRKNSLEEFNLNHLHASPIEDAYHAKELATLIREEIELLPSKMRKIFVLSRYKNMTVSEISTELEIAPRTVKNQLSNALKILRTRIIPCKG
nr:RNA polymerase sigma-70 factor [uncultured Pedobacter sp.]